MIINLNQVSFRYEKTYVLQDITLQVERGANIAVLGPNGSGKTTLIKIILGLLTPESGEVQVLGQSPKLTRSRIGYVPQHVDYNPLFPLIGQDLVLMGLPKKRIYRSDDIKQALDIMQTLDVAHLAQRRIVELSGGELQRLVIARALVSQPDILLFDEPTANIDPYGKTCFFDVINSLPTDITVIIVSHDLTILAAKIDRVVALNKQLLTSEKSELTTEMLQMIYGIHDHECSAVDYLRRFAIHD